MGGTMKVLIIEDNPRLSERMKQQLQKWYTIDTARMGDEALSHLAHHSTDIILLDLGLPDIPGLELCKMIRDVTSDTPILTVTGIDSTESRVSLLDAGADDYITKPFQLDELRARINALSRRRVRSVNSPLITLGDLTIDPSSRKVNRGGVAIQLRKKEFDILEYLASNPGRVLSREMIVHKAWPITGKAWTGSVDVHIKQIRDKVDRPFSYPLIKTAYGVGYLAETPVNVAATD